MRCWVSDAGHKTQSPNVEPDSHNPDRWIPRQPVPHAIPLNRYTLPNNEPHKRPKDPGAYLEERQSAVNPSFFI